MSGIALKLSSLVIRTVSKPIANAIKHQAREHEGFRTTCINFAQFLHRVDMRMRLGLLRDTAAIERQAAKEAAEATAKKHKSQIPTVKTEAQVKAEAEEAAKIAKEKVSTRPKPKIRPLSEAKAIESGATFISEAFLFTVAGGLVVFESYRSRKKESTRRDDVASRIGELEEAEKVARRALVDLEREVLRLRALNDTKSSKKLQHIIPTDVWKLEEKEEKEEEEKSRTWLERITSYMMSSREEIDQSVKEVPVGMPVSSEVVKEVLPKTQSGSDTGPKAEKSD